MSKTALKHSCHIIDIDLFMMIIHNNPRKEIFMICSSCKKRDKTD